MADFEKVEFEFPDEIEAKGKPEEETVNQEAKGKPEAEFEIEIEDDTPKEARQKRPPMPAEEVEKLRLEVDELDNYSEEAKVKLIKMKKVWNDERRAKEAAERERHEAINAAQRLLDENKRIKSMLSNGEKEYVDAMKSSADMQLEIARKAYKEAYDSGDAEKVMEAQQLMTDAALRLDKVKNFKMPPLQEEKFEVKREEQYQSPPKPDARVMAWQEENPWFGQDEEMTASALGLHEKLKRQGVVIGSEQYYATLDKTMRKRFPEQFEDAEEVAVKAKEDNPPKAKPSTVVAPATRSTASKKVKLTTTQVALAKRLGLTPEQYVRELLKVEA